MLFNAAGEGYPGIFFRKIVNHLELLVNFIVSPDSSCAFTPMILTF